MTPSWFVFGPDDGEIRYLRPPARSGTVTILVDPKNSASRHLAMGHQRLDPGVRFPPISTSARMKSSSSTPAGHR